MPKENFQLKSMTAFGRGVNESPYGRFTVEIQSVNRRFLELNINLPRLFNRFEMDIRKELSAVVGRGMVNVSLSWKIDPQQKVSITPNLALAKALKDAWEKLSQELKLYKELPVELLLQERDLFIHDDELSEVESYREGIMKALHSALAEFIEMKEKEGKALSQDLKTRLKFLETELSEIESRSGNATEKQRQKLTARLEELFSGSVENEEKILREIAVFAEKVDITEEITRFKSHLEQFSNTLMQSAESSGKVLDFLLQELLRETNTMGSKASDIVVAQKVVSIKSELEKIKEQVQNIE